MTRTALLEQFVGYLSSVRDLYPGGVPEKFIVDEDPEESSSASDPELETREYELYAWRGNKSDQLLFITTRQEGQNLGPASLELFKSAVLKGLKIKLEEVSLIALTVDSAKSREGEFRDCLAGEIRDLSPRGVVVLGQAVLEYMPEGSPAVLEQGEWGSLAGVPVICTCDLEMVLSDIQFKKEFWNVLKQVMKRLF